MPVQLQQKFDNLTRCIIRRLSEPRRSSLSVRAPKGDSVAGPGRRAAARGSVQPQDRLAPMAYRASSARARATMSPGMPRFSATSSPSERPGVPTTSS